MQERTRSIHPAPILIVHPDMDLTTSIKNTLEHVGDFACTVVQNTAEAMIYLSTASMIPAACLVALSQDGGHAWDTLLHHIKERNPATAIIVMTQEHDRATLLECLKKGAIEYLFIPFDATRLPTMIASAIHRQGGATECQGAIEAVNPFDGWVELTASSELEYLARMQRFIEALLLTQLPEGVREDLRLTIEELGRNAIEWGNRFDRSKQFRISYCLFEDRIVLKFEDEGEGFKPQAIPDPTTDPIAHIKKRKADGKRPGGFGVFLVQKIMDEVLYSERGNVVVMTKFFKEKSSGQRDLLQDI